MSVEHQRPKAHFKKQPKFVAPPSQLLMQASCSFASLMHSGTQFESVFPISVQRAAHLVWKSLSETVIGDWAIVTDMVNKTAMIRIDNLDMFSGVMSLLFF